MAKGNFIEYVISDDPNKYPTDGEHGGYYYELFDGSGAYVWKKYNVEFVQGASVTVTLQNDGTSINLYTIDNLYLKDDSTVGIQGDVAKTVAISSLLEGTVLGGMNPTYYAYGEDGLVYAYPRCSSDETAVTTSNPVTAEKGEFIVFIADNDSNAYPDGGEQGGYWYEKVVEGVDLLSATGYTKMAVDKITFPSDTNLLGSTIPHSLGEKPSMYIFVGEAISITDYSYVKSIMGMDNPAQNSYSPSLYAFYANASSGIFSPVNLSTSISDLATSIKVTNTSLKLKAGVEYALITMA